MADPSSEMRTPTGLHIRPTSAPPERRRLFHMAACGAIPLLGIFVGSSVMVALLATASGLALLVELARFRLPFLNMILVTWFKPLLKDTEDRRITGATYIAIAALACFLVFDKSVAVVALFFLALGDPLAALVGSRMGRFRIFGKSPLGTLAFVAVAIGLAGILSAVNVVPFHWGLVVGAVVAALVELAPSPLDDNLTIPLISGAAMTGAGV